MVGSRAWWLLLLLVILSVGGVGAQPGPAAACRVPSHPGAAPGWTVELHHSAQGFDIEATQDANRSLQASFDLASGAFDLEADNGTPTVGPSVRTRLVVVAVVEFRDTNGDGRFGPGDAAVRRHTLVDAQGKTFQMTPRADGGYDGLAVYPLNGNSGSGLPLDPDVPRGQLRVIVTLAPTAGSSVAAADRIPVSFHVQDFPFFENETRLALELRHEAAVAPTRTLHGLEAPFAAGRVLVRWADCARVDGQAEPSEATTVEDVRSDDAHDTQILFAYPGARLVEQESLVAFDWAPQTSLAPMPAAALALGDWGSYLSGAVLTVAVVGGAVWRRLRGGA